MIYLKLFEDYESNKTLKVKSWHSRNPSPSGTILEANDLPKFGIPNQIIDVMKKWDVIYKSPYGNSFYSSTDISWDNKPDGSYRVSDHWNFKSRRDDRIHCITDEIVKNNTHYSIGKFNLKSGKYSILMSELSTTENKRIKDNEEKLRYLRDPEVIKMKRLFKDRIRNGEIFTEFSYNGIEYKGRIDKYTGIGCDIRLLNSNGDIIFSNNEFLPKAFRLYDINGVDIIDPL